MITKVVRCNNGMNMYTDIAKPLQYIVSYGIAPFKLDICICVLVLLLKTLVRKLVSFMWAHDVRHEIQSSRWVICSWSVHEWSYFTYKLHVTLHVKYMCAIYPHVLCTTKLSFDLYSTLYSPTSLSAYTVQYLKC